MTYDSIFPAIFSFFHKLCINLELPKPYFHGFYCLSLEKRTAQELQQDFLNQVIIFAFNDKHILIHGGH